MIARSVKYPAIGWRIPSVAVLMGLFLPMILGVAFLYMTDAPLTGLPKDGTARSFEQHIAFVAAALAAAPIIGWVILPLAIPILRLLVQVGWAGPGSALALALVLGLPLVHWMLNGDVTTESSAILGHVIVAMLVQGAVGWAVLQVQLMVPSNSASP